MSSSISEVKSSNGDIRYKIKYTAKRVKSFDTVATELINESGSPDENKNFYDSLNKSFGGHQQLGMPLSKSGLQKGWHDLALHYGYEKASDVNIKEDYYVRDNLLRIPCGSGRTVYAGEKGKVSSIKSDCITVAYDNGFIVDYYGSTSGTKLATGAAVENGTELFKTSSSGLNLSVRKDGAYLNPYYLFFNDEKQNSGNAA